MIDVAVIVPVLDRPHRVRPLAESLAASVRDALLVEATLFFVCSPGDRKEIEAVQGVAEEPCERPLCANPLIVDWPAGQGDYARKINFAAGHRWTREHEFLFLGADDLDFQPGWVEEALVVHLRENACVVGTNDQANQRTRDGRASTHTLVYRDYLECGTIDGSGALLSEVYDHQYVDDELVATARARGTYAHAPLSVVRHLHPHHRTAPMDATYKKALAKTSADHALFKEREPLWAKL